MISNIGPGMLIIICVVALVIFGPKKLPELGRSIGITLREFKNGTKDVFSDEESKDNNANLVEDNDESKKKALKAVNED
ncbi:twin-arginine translocase TatA/TatE family subunit [Radiobacillus sp. PE A8.2]|uniref:twin-arginine translocase TatA/TatE family subunit n=1 Tax=Radiobacillus sp. PE A8.2 TaxID=3380349 RepID=UPI00388EC725